MTETVTAVISKDTTVAWERNDRDSQTRVTRSSRTRGPALGTGGAKVARQSVFDRSGEELGVEMGESVAAAEPWGMGPVPGARRRRRCCGVRRGAAS